MAIFDSAILDFAARRKYPRDPKGRSKSAKIELCVIVKNSLIKNFPNARESGGNLNLQDRTNLDSALTSRFQARMVRISNTLASVWTNFVLGSNSEAPNFYGEFDSGSERTLAAWIRHASRTGLSV